MGSEEEARDDVQGQVLNETLNGLACRGATESTAACCVICLADITEPCTARPCAHNNFDFLCLASWLQQKTCCPLCKAEVLEIQYDFANEGKNYMTYRVPKIGLEPASEASRHELRPTAPPYHRFRGRAQPYRGFSRRAFPPPPSDPERRAQGALDRRRQIYRDQLYSLHVGSNASSGYKDVTIRQLQTDPDLLSRARAWARRELQVFEFLSHSEAGSNVDGRRQRQQNSFEFVLEYVIAILKTVDLQASSGHAETLLSDFLGRDNCQIFLHELRNFLRSPFSIEAWDRHVQYDESKPASSSRSQDASEEVIVGRDGALRPVGDRYRPRAFEHRSRPRSSRSHPHGNHDRRGRSDSWRPR